MTNHSRAFRPFSICVLLGALAATGLIQCSSDDDDGDGGNKAGANDGGDDPGGSSAGGKAGGGSSAGGSPNQEAGAGGEAEAGSGGQAALGGMGGAGGEGGAVDDPRLDLYVGCRDPGKGTIEHYRIEPQTGVVAKIDQVLAGAEVSNTAWNAAQTILYVAHTDTGRITTFKRNLVNGKLKLQAAVQVPGEPLPTDNPATQTLEVDATGKWLLAANYTANTVLVYAIKPDGSVGDLVDSLTDGLNAHQTLLNNTNEFALVPYYGSNFIAVYDFDAATGQLSAHVPLTTAIPAADSGPRHLALHQNAKWLYAITENAGSIALFDFDNTTAALSHVETVSSVAADFVGAVKSGSEIEIAGTGKFLYVSNRTDGVAEGNVGAYAISEVDGKLTPLEHHQTHGKTPRQFSLSPDGKLLVVGNQGSDNMSVFQVNTTTGKLIYVDTTNTCAVPFFARMAVHE
jgi:6-phosphogluconolactonase